MSSLQCPSKTLLQGFHGASYMKVLTRSCRGACENSCEDPDEILSEVFAWSCTGLSEKILWRSCWHLLLVRSSLRRSCIISYILVRRPVANLIRSSQRGPCIKILQTPCIRGACMKALLGCSWEVLVSRSCKILSSSSRSFYDDLVRLS